MPTTILHFADAHIDMANYGRHDPESGLPVRVMDFLKSLDTIVEAAISEKVDLVLFAGDAYKDRSPAPTFQREWSRRIMRLSRAGIPTLLLVGNHDLSPALNRAHALDPFSTLEVPRVRVLDRPVFLTPADLWDLPLQVLAIPWVSRSALMAQLELSAAEPGAVYEQLEERLSTLVQTWLERADPTLPIVLTAHASVQGARFGGERTVMLGSDLVLPAALVKDPRLSYVALGHIHKPQDLNEGSQPPAIYPGSIERVDFGEAREDKFYILAHLQTARPTQVEWRKLSGIRPFIDRRLAFDSADGLDERLAAVLPPPEALEGAIVRLVLEYPRPLEAAINEAALRRHAERAFEFHLVRRPHLDTRVRIAEDQNIGALTPLELLDLYWKASHAADDEIPALNDLAKSVIQAVEAPGAVE